MCFKLIIFFLIVQSCLYAQNIHFNALIESEGKSCDTELKQFSIVKKLINRDTTIFVTQDTSCKFEQVLLLANGAYFFRVKSISSPLVEIAFEVKGSSDEKIDLGTIKLGTKISQVEEVTITGIPKKFILIDPEKTIITVENNPVLESSSLYDAITRIPGIIPGPSGGFTYSGQVAGVLFEGIPSSLSRMDLDNLLRALPGTSVKKIHLVTNPEPS